ATLREHCDGRPGGKSNRRKLLRTKKRTKRHVDSEDLEESELMEESDDSQESEVMEESDGLQESDEMEGLDDPQESDEPQEPEEAEEQPDHSQFSEALGPRKGGEEETVTSQEEPLQESVPHHSFTRADMGNGLVPAIQAAIIPTSASKTGFFVGSVPDL
ncbi:hypothetical protein LTS18_009943, partial [Coniosporium uncinatum]